MVVPEKSAMNTTIIIKSQDERETERGYEVTFRDIPQEVLLWLEGHTNTYEVV